MPIVVDRNTGAIISRPEYSQEAYDRAWARIGQYIARNHPELLPLEPAEPEGSDAE